MNRKILNKVLINTLKLAMYIFLLIIVLIISYVIYMQAGYYRIEDNKELAIENNNLNKIKTNEEYKIVTMNVGFGAYEKDFSFFLDKTTTKDGKIIKGERGKGISFTNVQNNIQRTAEILKKENADIYLIQEVDKPSTRSYNMDQVEELKRRMNAGEGKYSSIYAENLHSTYYILPFHDMHGIANAGLQTLSKYSIENSVRKSLPVTTEFYNKFKDLDRALMINRSELENGKELIVINAHLSAYDKGGVIRKKQMELLNEIMKQEKEKGNYVIIGGDFNHDYCDSRFDFNGNMKVPENAAILTPEEIEEGYRLVVPKNKKEIGTCRVASQKWNKETSYQSIIDGFIVSDNIEAEAEIINADYETSDHNPVKMKFKLKD